MDEHLAVCKCFLGECNNDIMAAVAFYPNAKTPVSKRQYNVIWCRFHCIFYCDEEDPHIIRPMFCKTQRCGTVHIVVLQNCFNSPTHTCACCVCDVFQP